MNKNIKNIYKFEIVILFINILLFFIKSATNKNIISIIGFGILLLALYAVYKRKKDTNFYRGTAFRIVLSVILFYFIIVFSLGLLLGFNKTLFSLSFNTWLQGLIPTLIITILVERIRYILIRNNKTERKGIIAITILIIVYNIIMEMNISTLNNNYQIFLFVCTIVIPVIAKDTLTSYMVYKYGFLPGIVYKLIMNLYVYILPIQTNLGDYLYSAVNILIPFTIYMLLQKNIKDNEELEAKKARLGKINFNFIALPTSILLVIIITLVSGIFKYQMIAIASNSMEPTFERGDAIIFEKVNKDEIKVGDIIVFQKNKIIVAHRAIKIQEDTSNLYFYTKGDANNSPDTGTTMDEDVYRSG